jgi:uncharacterized protein (TIRG00374 family)
MKTLRRIMADQKLKMGLALTVGIGLLALWLSAVDLRAILSRLAGIDLRWLSLYALLWLSAAFLRSLRWRIILSRVATIPPLESFAAFMSCMFINFLVPLRLGEAVASLALKRNRGIPFAKSLPTQAMDRLFDLTPIVPALVMVLLMGGKASAPLIGFLVFVAVVFSMLSGLVVLSMARTDLAVSLVRACARVVPSAIRPRVESFAVLCIQGLGELKLGAATIAGLMGMTFLALAIDAASVQAVFMGLGYVVAPATMLAGYTLFFLMSALPRPPGQVGSHEVLFLLIFSLLLGVDKNVASAAVLAGHLTLALLLTAIGSLSLFALGIRSVSVVRDHLPSATTTGAS